MRPAPSTPWTPGRGSTRPSCRRSRCTSTAWTCSSRPPVVRSVRPAPSPRKSMCSRATAPVTRESLSVNHPLSVSGTKVFLLGNGYAPVITVKDSTGKVVYSQATPFLPQDGDYLSLGVVKVPAARPLPLGLRGFFLPTAALDASGNPVSVFPALGNPTLVLSAYEGDLQLGGGALGLHPRHRQDDPARDQHRRPGAAAQAGPDGDAGRAARARSPSPGFSGTPASRCVATRARPARSSSRSWPSPGSSCRCRSAVGGSSCDWIPRTLQTPQLLGVRWSAWPAWPVVRTPACRRRLR